MVSVGDVLLGHKRRLLWQGAFDFVGTQPGEAVPNVGCGRSSHSRVSGFATQFARALVWHAPCFIGTAEIRCGYEG
jgi:hypothetical protein